MVRCRVLKSCWGGADLHAEAEEGQHAAEEDLGGGAWLDKLQQPGEGELA